MSLFLLSVSLFAGITLLYTLSVLLIVTSSAEKHDSIYNTLVVANAMSLSVLGAMSIAYVMSLLGEFMVDLSMHLMNPDTPSIGLTANKIPLTQHNNTRQGCSTIHDRHEYNFDLQ